GYGHFSMDSYMECPSLKTSIVQNIYNVLFQKCVVSTELFSVVVPETTVSGQLGGSVTLPCALSDNLDVRQLEVRWYRPSMYSSPALLYLNEKLDLSVTDITYQGRVSLPGPLEKGDVSLKLDDLRSSDLGMYMCHRSELGFISINANVILSFFLAVGSSPILSMLDAGGGKVNVSCQSHGWLPKPSLSWRDSDGSSLNPPNKHTSTKGSPVAHFRGSSLHFSSSITHKGTNECVYIYLYIHVCVFVGIWMIAFFGTLILLLLLIIGVGVYFVVLKKGVFYLSLKLNMDMDSAETPEFFKITQGGSGMSCTHPIENHEEYRIKIFTLCKEKFSSGQQYWELKVKEDYNQKLSWYVGVATEEAKRINGIRFTPAKGFWVLFYEEGKGVCIRESPTPTTLSHISADLSDIGVFLDCDNHTLSFFNTETQSHLHTFTSVTFTTSLRPLISPGIRDTVPVKICNNVLMQYKMCPARQSCQLSKLSHKNSESMWW
uniref:Ig-like domain-containing protein n=1 Tax=Astyanax mexicanus TaxID=7994 RepID=A0A8B9LX60_ASTMX